MLPRWMHLGLATTKTHQQQQKHTNNNNHKNIKTKTAGSGWWLKKRAISNFNLFSMKNISFISIINITIRNYSE